MPLVDENAFGILIAYYSIENDEYALERDDFIARFSEFRAAVLEYLTTLRLADAATVLEFGHAVYLEFADGAQREDPLSYAKGARALLRGREFESAIVVVYGGRWIEDEAEVLPEVGELGEGLRFAQLSRPSEPLRKALAADAASRRDADDERGWGPGLYFDVEALEALNRLPKNAPTALEFAGATFYRAGR